MFVGTLFLVAPIDIPCATNQRGTSALVRFLCRICTLVSPLIFAHAAIVYRYGESVISPLAACFLVPLIKYTYTY